MALVRAAWAWRRLMFRTTVIAITGSVGKSTTKECLAAILSAHGLTRKTRNNVNGTYGGSLTILGLRPWHRYAVIEVGTEAPGQIRSVARFLKPDIAIVLTIARNHSNAFPTLDDTAREKATLLEYLKRDGIAILNADDEHVRAMAQGTTRKVVLFGQTPDCDVVASDVSSVWPERLHFTAKSGDEEAAVGTQLVGAQWLNSALAALTAAQACGVPLSKAAGILAEVPPFTARMQPVQLPNGVVVIRDEESSSVDGLEAMYEVMRTARAQRRWLVFNDVLDMGTHTRRRIRDAAKAAVGIADVMLFVGEPGHHGQRGAINAGMDPENCHFVADLKEASEFLKRELRPGDLVFVKGLHHLSRLVFDQIGEIGCWRRECRIRPLCDLCAQLKPSFDLKQALSAPISVMAQGELEDLRSAVNERRVEMVDRV